MLTTRACSRLAHSLVAYLFQRNAPSLHASYPLRFIRHQFPSHVFASHRLWACFALPCSCLEPSALGVRPALFTKCQQKPETQVAHVATLCRHRQSLFARVSPPFHSGETLTHPKQNTRKNKKRNLTAQKPRERQLSSKARRDKQQMYSHY